MLAEQKRFALVAVILVAVMGLLAWGLVTLLNQPTRDTTAANKLSDSDKTSLTLVTQDFVTRAGSWGIVTEKLTSETINDVGYLVATNAPGAEAFVRSKASVYNSYRDELIAPLGPLDFSRETVENWQDTTLFSELLTMEVNDVTAAVPQEARRFTYRGEQVRSVDVAVTASFKGMARTQAATDTDWNGDWIVSEGSFPESFTVVLLDTAEGWRVYNVEGLEDTFLLAGLNDPAASSYGEKLFGFQETGVIPSKI